MIPTNANSSVNSNIEEHKNSQFSISSNPYIIDLLSTKLYDFPEEALIRELLSNALDEHRKSNVAQPVEIHVLTKEDVTTLEFKDYGSGMSPLQFQELFVNIGTSSKDKSNDQHGGYGIGALTIFAAAEQATLVTSQKDYIYSYLLYRDGEKFNLPTANLISREPNKDNRRGTSITVPLNSKNLTKICGYLIQLTCMIASKVVVHGANYLFKASSEQQLRQYRPFIESKINKLEGKTFDFYYVDSYPRIEDNSISLHIQVGDITYQIDSKPSFVTSLYKKLGDGKNNQMLNVIRDFRYSNLTYAHVVSFARSYLCLKFPIGSLDLPGSREYISETERNLELISKYLLGAWAEFSNAYANLLHNNSMLSLVTKLNSCSKLKVTNLPLREADRINLLKIKSIDMTGLDVPCNVLTNLRFTDNKHSDRDRIGSIKSKEVTPLQILIKSLELDSSTQIVYWLGPLERAASVVRKQFPGKLWFLIRCFEDQDSLDTQTALEVDRAIDKIIIVKQKASTEKQLRVSITYDSWANKQNPVGLSKIDFETEDLNQHLTKATGPVDPYVLKYYFTYDNYKPSTRIFYKALVKSLRIDQTIYYLTPAAAKLVQKDTYQNWEPAFTLLDELCFSKLLEVFKLCSKLEINPAFFSIYGGWVYPKDTALLIHEHSERDKCIKIITNSPSLELIVGKENIDNLNFMSEAHIIAVLLFSTYNWTDNSLAKSSNLCKQSLSGFVGASNSNPDTSYLKLITACLGQLLQLTPLIEATALFNGTPSRYNHDLHIRSAEAISKSIPMLLSLHQKS
jgi:hypothetical protein